MVTAALEPIEGAYQIAQFLVDRANRLARLTILERTVNPQPGLVAQLDGVAMSVMAFDVAGSRIRNIWAVLKPETLRLWSTA